LHSWLTGIECVAGFYTCAGIVIVAVGCCLALAGIYMDDALFDDAGVDGTRIAIADIS
jgi:hypothetical protein